MAEAKDTAGLIYQNLIDAGCDAQTTQNCMALVKQGSYGDLLPLLTRHRAGLLQAVHCGQKQLDCLDYLLYQIEQEKF